MDFLDLFAGVGGFRRGMELAGHKCVGFCEWDKFAAASYTSMHLITEEQRSRLSKFDLKARQKEILKEEYRNGEWYSADVRLITGDTVPRADCWCFGAPCQDFSIAGNRAGLGGDRSSLVREVFRVLGELKEEDRPEWLIYENVKGMLSSNRGFDYLAILLEMDELGYDCEWELFNTKHFGVPQNRERVYTVGHLRSRGERKIFPLTGADGEDSVCEVKIIGKTTAFGHEQNGRIYDEKGIAPCLNGIGNGGNHEPKIPVAVIPVSTPEVLEKNQNGRRFKEDGDEMFTLTARDRHGVALGVLRGVRSDYGKKIRKDYEKGLIDISRHEFKEYEIRNDNVSNTIDSVQKDNLVAVKINEATKKGYAEAHEGDSINLTMPESQTRRGRVGVQCAQTLDCACNQGVLVKLADDLTVYAVWYEKYQCYIAIRRLTPRECFRLQGWTDDYFDKAAFINSDSQLYKQAGNGVTVDVVAEIGKQM